MQQNAVIDARDLFYNKNDTNFNVAVTPQEHRVSDLQISMSESSSVPAGNDSL